MRERAGPVVFSSGQHLDRHHDAARDRAIGNANLPAIDRRGPDDDDTHDHATHDHATHDDATHDDDDASDCPLWRSDAVAR